MKLAAIDIGSNAARLLLSESIESESGKLSFNKLNFLRVPLRLGFDVFEHKVISEEKCNMLLHTMHAFKHLMSAYKIEAHIACATSAMRDASNGAEIIHKVKKETGILINIISGDEEAAIIYESHIAENLNKNEGYLYVDVGGGSTELTYFNNNKLLFKQSFNIGTIRLLKNQIQETNWDLLRDFIKSNINNTKKQFAIGSGGNINKVFSMSKKKDGKPLHIDLLKDYYKELNSVPLAARMDLFKLRKDRADVIVPALLIYINVLKWAGIEEIYVPKIGLSDGLIQHLYQYKLNGGELF